MSNIVSIPPLFEEENVAELEEQAKKFQEYAKLKRNWENAFQKWSNRCATDIHVTDSFGCCGYGAMCDYCEDNSYGRPCVRALNVWCREEYQTVDYTVRDFEKIWRGEA